MTTVLYILAFLGALGAFDTLYYHEWRLRLPNTPGAASELRLHAVRDAAYTIVFFTLAWTTWNGAYVWPLAAILLFEVWATLADFLEEDRTRKLPAGERVMHAVMGIVYGVFLAELFPHAAQWSRMASGFGGAYHGLLSWVLTVLAIGVFCSGVRDFAASRKLLA
jgi:hypothetical protein